MKATAKITISRAFAAATGRVRLHDSVRSDANPSTKVAVAFMDDAIRS